MKNPKTVTKNTAIIVSAVIAVIMTASSVICVALSLGKGEGKSEYLSNAESVVSEFVSNSSLNSFTFMDGLFAKANVVSAAVSEQTSAEQCGEIAKSLKLNSFMVTDGEGKIINSDNADLIGKNITDDENTRQFKTVLKGNTYKSISEPKAAEGKDGFYNLMACVTRSAGGVVIIDIDTDTYALVTGENLAESCKGDTIIAKDGGIISTNLDTDAATLSDLKITDDMLKAKCFEIKTDDKLYTLSTENVEGYTVISGTEMADGGFDFIYGVIVPLAVLAAVIILSVVVFSAVSVDERKK